MERIALYNDSFQNWKTHDIKKGTADFNGYSVIS